MQPIKGKRVALALSSGGPRGLAYIGALEELEQRGYEVSAIAGTSMGALIGGVYAAGCLDKFKEWMLTLDGSRVFSLMDISISMNSFVKGDRIIEAIKEVVPDVLIEELPIPFCAIATDLYTGQEVVFDKGSLFEAIRASISIPSMFRPVEVGRQMLIDGHSSNCLPLNRVARSEGDILVGFDVNDIDINGIHRAIDEIESKHATYDQLRKEKHAEVRSLATTMRSDSSRSIFARIREVGVRGWRAMQEMKEYREQHLETLPELDWGENVFSLIDRTLSIMNYHSSRRMAELYRPDILVKMPFDAYDSISDYALAQEISECGRYLMREALDEYEQISK